MNPDEMKQRTKKFSLRIIKLVEALPLSKVAQTIGSQLLRSGTSVGANYRAACRARSKAEFISNVGIVIEEADESLFWMELLIESGQIKTELLSPLMQECNEIVAILTASSKTAKSATRTIRDHV